MMDKMTQDDLRDLIRETVRSTMLDLGVSTDDALEMQRDMGFLRDLRKARDDVTTKAVMVSVGLLVTATLGAIALGVREWLA